MWTNFVEWVVRMSTSSLAANAQYPTTSLGPSQRIRWFVICSFTKSFIVVVRCASDKLQIATVKDLSASVPIMTIFLFFSSIHISLSFYLCLCLRLPLLPLSPSLAHIFSTCVRGKLWRTCDNIWLHTNVVSNRHSIGHTHTHNTSIAIVRYTF